MSEHTSKRWLIALGLTLVVLPSSAFAQFHDADPFGDSDEAAPEPTPSSVASQATAGGALIDPSTTALFGTGSGPNGVAPMPKGDDTWGDLNTLPTDERIEDTYEMKMREELNKPMPKHNPFNDRFEDMRQQMNPKKSPGRDKL
ncbi:MAG: hypothetical protein U0136_07995 [Bdellovibrionota bacterium]